MGVVLVGTDVYLKWDGMSEEDKKRQYTGFSIDAGAVGYLRASSGMEAEQSVLCLLFPVRIWESDSAVEYDFVENLKALRSVVSAYLRGDRLDVQDRCKEKVALGKKVGETLRRVLGDEFVCSPGMSADDRQIWAKSLADFFELGDRLQREGKRPRVYISW